MSTLQRMWNHHSWLHQQVLVSLSSYIFLMFQAPQASTSRRYQPPGSQVPWSIAASRWVAENPLAPWKVQSISNVSWALAQGAPWVIEWLKTMEGPMTQWSDAFLFCLFCLCIFESQEFLKILMGPVCTGAAGAESEAAASSLELLAQKLEGDHMTRLKCHDCFAKMGIDLERIKSQLLMVGILIYTIIGILSVLFYPWPILECYSTTIPVRIQHGIVQMGLIWYMPTRMENSKNQFIPEPSRRSIITIHLAFCFAVPPKPLLESPASGASGHMEPQHWSNLAWAMAKVAAKLPPVAWWRKICDIRTKMGNGAWPNTKHMTHVVKCTWFGLMLVLMSSNQSFPASETTRNMGHTKVLWCALPVEQLVQSQHIANVAWAFGKAVASDRFPGGDKLGDLCFTLFHFFFGGILSEVLWGLCHSFGRFGSSVVLSLRWWKMQEHVGIITKFKKEHHMYT